MPNKQQERHSALSEEGRERIEDLKKKLEGEINGLPEDDPSKCEGLIRELHGKVVAVLKADVKDYLLTKLKTVSSRGLNEDLKDVMEKNGLGLEGLKLVLKYLTTKDELAQYLFMTPEEVVVKEGLDAIRRRLRPKLEVLGGLHSKGIDVKQGWVKNLVTKAPCLWSLGRLPVAELEELCNEASHGEMKEVLRLAKIAESRNGEISDTPNTSEEAGAKDRSYKAIDEEKLEKARALMNEAKETAKGESAAATKAVEEKITELAKTLELPPDWNKQATGQKPDQLLEQLDGIINEFDNPIEVSECYKSDLEVVEKASGGRTLCGIYYSEYLPPKTSERPIIMMPAKVTLASPNNSQQIRYLRFSQSRAASNYVQTVKSSSTNVGFSVGGFWSLFVGEASGSYGSSHEEEEVKSKKENTDSVSVLQYIWIATKTFKIEQEEMRLSTSARRMARSITREKGKEEEAARHFMERYGSHLPAGLHTLGGVLFRIVDAESSGMQNTSKLTEKAAQHLQGQISVGFLGGAFGIGASINSQHTESSGKVSAREEEAVDTSYTYSFQVMGPAATNPATFTKLLANNSTWALIDRGSKNAYIPVWELMRELGSDFNEAAEVLESTWLKDEKENKQKSLRVGYKVTEIIKSELKRLRDQCKKKV